jgi:hypothetical protein
MQAQNNPYPLFIYLLESDSIIVLKFVLPDSPDISDIKILIKK